MGAVFAPTRFSLVRISIRDLVADGKYLVRNSEVGGGGVKSWSSVAVVAVAYLLLHVDGSCAAGSLGTIAAQRHKTRARRSRSSPGRAAAESRGNQKGQTKGKGKSITWCTVVRSAPKGRQQMGETGFCKNLRFSAVSCENLRFSAQICDSRIPWFTERAENQRRSAKICESVRSGSGFSLLLSPF